MPREDQPAAWKSLLYAKTKKALENDISSSYTPTDTIP